MLLDVTALLHPSANANAVAEAFDVPATQPPVVVVAPASLGADRLAFEAALDSASSSGSASAPAAVLITRPQTAPVQRLAASRVAALTGMPLLQQLGLMDRAQLAAFAAGHGDALQRLAAHPPAAEAVDAWWAQLPSSEQDELVAGAPDVVGDMEGVPYAARDRANRSSLSRAEDAITAQLRAGAGRAASDELTRRLHMLEQVRTALAAGSSDDRALVELDTDGTGTAQIVVGDLETADYVTYLVPGMFSSVDSEITTWADGASRIAADQQGWLDRLSPTGASDQSVAVVAWFGYQTPDVSDVTTLGPARQAEAALDASIGGLQAARGLDQPYLTVVGHSYGSTAAMLALQDGGMSVDAMVAVGSPGSTASSVTELRVADGNVWAAAADWDPVARSAIFGTSPTARSFGAHGFGVDGATDPITGQQLASAHLHTDYFSAGSESLRNIELIALGRGDLVIGAPR